MSLANRVTIRQSDFCRICKEWAEDVPTHLRRQHNGMTVTQYIEQYPQVLKSSRCTFLFGSRARKLSLEDKEYFMYLQHHGAQRQPEVKAGVQYANYNVYRDD